MKRKISLRLEIDWACTMLSDIVMISIAAIKFVIEFFFDKIPCKILCLIIFFSVVGYAAVVFIFIIIQCHVKFGNSPQPMAQQIMTGDANCVTVSAPSFNLLILINENKLI